MDVFHLSVVDTRGGDDRPARRAGPAKPKQHTHCNCVRRRAPGDAALSEDERRRYNMIRMYQEAWVDTSGSGDAPQAPPRQALVGHEVNSNHMYTDSRMITTPSPYCSLHGYGMSPFIRAQSCTPSPAQRRSETAPVVALTLGATRNPHEPEGCMEERFMKMGLNVADR